MNFMEVRETIQTNVWDCAGGVFTERDVLKFSKCYFKYGSNLKELWGDSALLQAFTASYEYRHPVDEKGRTILQTPFGEIWLRRTDEMEPGEGFLFDPEEKDERCHARIWNCHSPQPQSEN